MSFPLHPLIESALLGLVTDLRAQPARDVDVEVPLDTVRGAIRCVYRDFVLSPGDDPSK